MHPEAYALMRDLLKPIHLPSAAVLDVGSLDVNGTYRPLVEGRGWAYTGLDIQPGRNVDVVSEPYHFPFEDERFDVVISGSTLEHVEHPWRWMPEAARVLKPDGWLVVITHWSFPLHEYPVDCFRFMPHGMKMLLDEARVLGDYHIQIANETDIYAVARKTCGR